MSNVEYRLPPNGKVSGALRPTHRIFLPDNAGIEVARAEPVIHIIYNFIRTFISEEQPYVSYDDTPVSARVGDDGHTALRLLCEYEPVTSALVWRIADQIMTYGCVAFAFRRMQLPAIFDGVESLRVFPYEPVILPMAVVRLVHTHEPLHNPLLGISLPRVRDPDTGVQIPDYEAAGYVTAPIVIRATLDSGPTFALQSMPGVSTDFPAGMVPSARQPFQSVFRSRLVNVLPVLRKFIDTQAAVALIVHFQAKASVFVQEARTAMSERFESLAMLNAASFEPTGARQVNPRRDNLVERNSDIRNLGQEAARLRMDVPYTNAGEVKSASEDGGRRVVPLPSNTMAADVLPPALTSEVFELERELLGVLCAAFGVPLDLIIEKQRGVTRVMNDDTDRLYRFLVNMRELRAEIGDALNSILFVYRLLRDRGTAGWVDSIVQLHKDEHGQPDGLMPVYLTQQTLSECATRLPKLRWTRNMDLPSDRHVQFYDVGVLATDEFTKIMRDRANLETTSADLKRLRPDVEYLRDLRTEGGKTTTAEQGRDTAGPQRVRRKVAV